MSDGISSAFQQRRQLAIAVAELARAENLAVLDKAAREIYDTFPDELIQAEILRNLGTQDGQLRGGLGQLAALLPADQMSVALRGIAADRSQTAQHRLTAAMLAAQYLGEPVPAALLSDLSGGNEVAFQSLLEAVEDGKENRYILLEYVLQMRQAGDHVPPMIMDLLDRLPEVDRIELLRLIALDDREAIAINALGRLELLAASSAANESLRALHILQFMLPPALAGYAQETLRRQRFRGNAFHPPKAEGWRALMTSCHVLGNQTVWFVRMPSAAGAESKRERSPEPSASSTSQYGRRDEEGDGVVVHVQFGNGVGIYNAMAEEGLTDEFVPPKIPIGETMPEEMFDLPTGVLEVPFDYARWRILGLTAETWKNRGNLPPEFALDGSIIWEFAAPDVPPGIRRYFDSGEVAGANVVVPSPEEVLALPSMETWLRENLVQDIAFDGQAPAAEEQRNARAGAILAQLANQAGDQLSGSNMAAMLRAQASWFEIAGDTEAAALAMALAELTPHMPAAQNPVLLALVQLMLDGS